jgi:hypothetical protein
VCRRLSSDILRASRRCPRRTSTPLPPADANWFETRGADLILGSGSSLRTYVDRLTISLELNK